MSNDSGSPEAATDEPWDFAGWGRHPRVDFVAVRGTFGPEMVEALSSRFDIPKNCMFIGTPGDRFPHRIEDLGGVRVVL